MTNIEKEQPDRIFRQAGRKAYKLNIYLDNNPYKDKYAQLWAEGWNIEKEIENKKWKPSRA